MENEEGAPPFAVFCKGWGLCSTPCYRNLRSRLRLLNPLLGLPRSKSDQTSRFLPFYLAKSRGCPTLCGFCKGWGLFLPSFFLAVSLTFLSSFISTCPSGSILLLVRRTTSCSKATPADDSPVPASPDSHACSRVSPAVSFPNTR